MDRARCLFFLLLLLVSGCATPSGMQAPTRRGPLPDPTAFQTRIQQIADQYVRRFPAVPGVLIHCDSPALGGVATAAAGFRDPRTRSQLRATDQFCSASISKMFVAATVLRSWEEGLLQVDAPIATYLPADLIDGLARINNVDHGKSITVRHCLAHTSGLADCYGDGVRSPDGLSPFEQELKRHPDKFWTSPEVIAWTKANLPPVAPPGVRYHYSDTGYQLLGLVIESVRKKPLAVAVREVVLDPLRMTETYAEFRETARRSVGVELSHYFDRAIDHTGIPSESADWGGGGWITNAPDLTRFLRSLDGDRLFRDPATGRLMQQPSPQSDGTYGLGLERFLVRGGHVMIGHGGYFGAFAAVWPEADMIVVATLNQSTPSTAKGHTETVQDLVAKVCRAFQRERRRSPAPAPQSRTPRTRQQIPPVAGTTQKP